MNVELLARLAGNTLTLGGLYALVGIGFVILFRSTGVVNFAEGSFMVLGAYVFYALVAGVQQPFGIGFAVALLTIAALGGGVYLAMFYRLLGAELFVTVIATMGLSVVLQTVTFLIWGPQVRSLPALLPNGTILSPLGVSLSAVDLLAIGTSLALIAALELTMQRTVLGIRMRAVADSPLLAALVRINVHAVSALAWSISALCAAVAGIAVALRVTAVDPVSLGQLGLLIFPVVIILGLDWIQGRAGQVSIGSAAFMAIGAYVTATVAGAGLPVIAALVLSALAGAVIGLVVGLPALRLRGLYLALSTLALQFITYSLTLQYETSAGKSAGFFVAPASFGPLELQQGRVYTLFLALALALVIIGLRNLYGRAPGRAWLAIKENETAAAGIRPHPTRSNPAA